MKFKPLIAAAALAFPIVVTADSSALRPSQSSVKTQNKKVTIDEHTIIFRGEVNDELVAKTMDKMYKSTQDTVTIFIDSPGGSIVAGLHLFELIANFNKPTICYVHFAASMAFALTQACTERYITDSSIMMQHQASFGGKGTVGHMSEMSRFAVNLSDKLTNIQAKRLGISKEKLEARVVNDWWMFGEEIVKNKAADKVVFMECKPELAKKTTKESVRVFMSMVDLTWSACPLITYPIDISISGGAPADSINRVKDILNDRVKYAKELKER